MNHRPQIATIRIAEWDTDAAVKAKIIEEVNLCLWRLGAILWEIGDMPIGASQPSETCWIGVDAPSRFGRTQPTRGYRGGSDPRIGGVALDASGRITATEVRRVIGGRGEFADEETFGRLILDLMWSHEQSTGRHVAHVVLHRDGKTQASEYGLVASELEQRGIGFDIVEIRKRGQVLLRQPENIDGTPHAGLCIARDVGNRAFLVNNRTIGRRRGSDIIYPAPNPICCVKVIGPTDFKTLVAQVYALAHAHATAGRFAGREPATTDYAHRLVRRRRLRDERDAVGGACNADFPPWWL